MRRYLFILFTFFVMTGSAYAADTVKFKASKGTGETKLMVIKVNGDNLEFTIKDGNLTTGELLAVACSYISKNKGHDSTFNNVPVNENGGLFFSTSIMSVTTGIKIPGNLECFVKENNEPQFYYPAETLSDGLPADKSGKLKPIESGKLKPIV